MALLGSCKPTGSPVWSREAAIGDYGGATDKRASETEGETPYSFAVYQSLKAQRGSAYTKDTGTLVHCENLALARTLAAVWYRTPEKLRANATPAHADERLEYWATVLGIPFSTTDARWRVRQNCAAHYQATKGPWFANVSDALTNLLGDVLVSVTTTTGSDLANPPDITDWPGVNPGPAEYNLGGGTWFSTRSRLTVEVQQTAGTTFATFLNLTRVQAFQLLDRMLPAWADFQIVVVSDGFNLDIDRLDIQALT